MDDSVPDRITGQSRQVDIAIRFRIGPQSYFVAVECKDFRTRAIDQPRVEQFASFIKSVGADSGIMVGSNGYSKAAKIYATAMGISLFSAREAESIEWEEFLLKTTRPVIKKRILVGDVVLISDMQAFRLSRKGSLDPTGPIVIYRRDGNEAIPMSEYRKKHRETDFNFFMNMPDLFGFLVELTCEQVETKLDTSRAAQFDRVRAQIVKETSRQEWEIRTVHLFFDSLKEASRDATALIQWTSEVWFPPFALKSEDYQRLQDLFVRFGDELFPFHGIAFRYGAEITLGRFNKDSELSEQDLNHGVVYIDHVGLKKEFFFMSHLTSGQMNQTP